MRREEVGKTGWQQRFHTCWWGQEHQKGSLWRQVFNPLSGPVSLYAGGCPAMFRTIWLLRMRAGAEHQEGRRLWTLHMCQCSFLTFDRRNRRQDRPAMRLQPSHRCRRGQSWSWAWPGCGPLRAWARGPSGGRECQGSGAMIRIWEWVRHGTYTCLFGEIFCTFMSEWFTWRGKTWVRGKGTELAKNGFTQSRGGWNIHRWAELAGSRRRTGNQWWSHQQTRLERWESAAFWVRVPDICCVTTEEK